MAVHGANWGSEQDRLDGTAMPQRAASSYVTRDLGAAAHDNGKPQPVPCGAVRGGRILAAPEARGRGRQRHGRALASANRERGYGDLFVLRGS